MGAAAILKLESVGFTREQAEALAEYLDDQVAKKADLRELELRLEYKLSETESRLDHKISETAPRLDHKIAETESRLKLWMVGQVFVIVGVLGTIGYFS